MLGVLQLLVDLEGLLGAVHVESIDLLDDVAVLDSDARVDATRSDAEQLEAVALAVLEGVLQPGKAIAAQ